jgi:rhamnose utilization protein RhaD (predicted bifunctional aldolase and dehydrogenase)
MNGSKMNTRKQSEVTSTDFDALKVLSADFGRNPLHIQGAGGNSSIKDGDKMWIKASGTLLGDALTREVFVPVDLVSMRTALEFDHAQSDTPAVFLIPGFSDLRPSIETSLHAVFSQRIVLHTHCIHTIAHAVQTNVCDLLAARLSEFNWAFVPYAKPGANLARSVMKVLKPDTDVIILGNHGLIVAGETINEVRALQNKVHSALALSVRELAGENYNALMDRVDDGEYVLPNDLLLHQIALSDKRVALVTAGRLYPDNVIFCGIAVTALSLNQSTYEVKQHDKRKQPVCLIVPEVGLLLHKDASMGARLMLRCLADVIMRLPENAELNYLTQDQNYELLDWDAEKYRQALNAE